jgi:hypothetical protein
MKTPYLYFQLMAALVIVSLSACKKLTDVSTPVNQLTTDKVFADTISAKAALFNIYVQLENQQYVTCNKYLSNYTDETLSLNNQDWNQSRINALESSSRGNWTYLYSVIYQCNNLIEQLQMTNALPATFSKRTVAEAKFWRAYANFFLVNLYGRIPLILGTDVNANQRASQSDSTLTYNQIISDLTSAKTDLTINYPGTGKIRVNKACATALLAKVHLYQKDWTAAESLATELINSGLYTPLESPANVFKVTSKESILQIATQAGFVTEAGGVIPSTASTAPSYYLTDAFYNSFENGDLRKINWIGTSTTSGSMPLTYRYPFKYKNRIANTTSPENLVVYRIAEQYLIRAEARAYQGKLTGGGSAAEDINVIRSRAGLGSITTATLQVALTAIFNERKHEMFFEMADRFLDLKRTGRINSVMSANKTTWVETGSLLPIPQSEVSVNANLKQNAGY